MVISMRLQNGLLKAVSKGETISDWMMEHYDKSRGKEGNAPASKNGFDTPTTKVWGNVYKGWFGYFLNVSSNVQGSEKDTALFSMNFSKGYGCDVTRNNFERVSISFSIRRAVQEYFKNEKKLWIRDKDTFTAPSDALLTDEFIADCVVYSLFDTQSNQTSLRQYEYNGKKYRVENEFFPFSMKFIEDLAIKHSNTDIQSDLTGEHERFVYSWLQEHEDSLSVEAKALLEKAKELFEITFEYRNEYAQDAPRYQTNSWDAGYAQIAKLAFGNERINDEFLDFKQGFYNLRTALGDKIALAAFNDGVI